MNITSCADVSACSAGTCNPEDIVCVEDLVVKIQFSQGLAAFLYLVFRILERSMYALHSQTSRELLQIERAKRCDEKYTMCCKEETFDCTKTCYGPFRCKRKCTCPTGVYKQMWLRFFGTLFGVASFLLILQQNIVMFALLVVIDVMFEIFRFRCQQKDHYSMAKDFHGDSDISWLLKPHDFSSSDIDEDWLENYKKMVNLYKTEQMKKEKASLELKYF